MFKTDFNSEFKFSDKARVFVPGKHFQPTVMQHSSLLALFVSYEENEVLRIQSLVPNYRFQLRI